LVVLTGDYVSWDPAAQEEVVQALAGLRAPYGVFGCLGNHEVITETEDSITRLFAAQGIRILRQERAPIRRSEEALNLLNQPDKHERANKEKHDDYLTEDGPGCISGVRRAVTERVPAVSVGIASSASR